MKIGILQWKRILKSACMLLKDNSTSFARLNPGSDESGFGPVMDKITSIMEKALDEWCEDVPVKRFLEDLGERVIAAGGDISLLWGSMFMGLAGRLHDDMSVDREQFVKMFTTALETVEEVTAAKIGDEGMVEALIPAVNAIKESNADIPSMLEEACAAARDYRNKTSFSRDSPAVSVYLFFEGMAKGLDM